LDADLVVVVVRFALCRLGAALRAVRFAGRFRRAAVRRFAAVRRVDFRFATLRFGFATVADLASLLAASSIDLSARDTAL
jgi:hypothetical protein